MWLAQDRVQSWALDLAMSNLRVLFPQSKLLVTVLECCMGLKKHKYQYRMQQKKKNVEAFRQAESILRGEKFFFRMQGPY
jgi:hypothetical protein